jgi:hypothetical protein
MRAYDYMVSYSFSKDELLGLSTGTSFISRSKKIKTFDDVASITDLIKNNLEGVTSIAINNIILLGRNKH